MSIVTDQQFVEPREAFQVVGDHLFGATWIPDCIDEPDSERRAQVLVTLRNILRSGQVTAHWTSTDFQTSGDLESKLADHEFFRIMLSEDRAFLAQLNEPIILRINVSELRAALAGEGHRKPQSIKTEKEFEREFTEKLRDKQFFPPTVAEHMAQMMREFPGLSKAGYKRARKAAVKATGRTDILRPGRRPN